MNFEKTIQKTTLGETVSRSGWSMTKIISTGSQLVYLSILYRGCGSKELENSILEEASFNVPDLELYW